MLASCSIPFWLDAVHDIPGAPRGAYWDGGITDYHLHLDYASLRRRSAGEAERGLVLYPALPARRGAGLARQGLEAPPPRHVHLDNVVLLSPHPDWVRGLPNAKLPDRNDFKHYGDDAPDRERAWQRAVAESERLADEFAAWVDGRLDLPVQPLR